MSGAGRELTDAEREALLTPCNCGHTLNDHGGLIPCWRCEDEGGDCGTPFEELLTVRLDRIVGERTVALRERLARVEALVRDYETIARWNTEAWKRYHNVARDLRAALGEEGAQGGVGEALVGDRGAPRVDVPGSRDEALRSKPEPCGLAFGDGYTCDKPKGHE